MDGTLNPTTGHALGADHEARQADSLSARIGCAANRPDDGIYLLFARLPVGTHTIHFTGTFEEPGAGTIDTSYHITVAPQ
jgi:hypothetical protein